MTDDHHEHHGFPFHFLRLGPSEEEIEQARMQSTANGHEFLDFLDGLTNEQLSHLKGMLTACHQSEGASALYYSGIISGLMQFKRKICIVCGSDHEQALHEMQSTIEPPSDDVNYCCGTTPAGSKHKSDCLLLAKYNVETNDNPDATPEESIKVMCKNCKMWYVSIDDRALRPADKTGCSGCVHKEMFG